MSTTFSEISIFNALKSKLGEKEAQVFVEGLKAEVNDQFENKKDTFLTQKDKTEILEKLAGAESRIVSSLIKWMFAFWVGTIGVLSGIIFAMLNAYIG